MYLDKQNLYSEGQALAAGASENVIDHSKKGDAYEALFLGVTVVPALAAGQTLAVTVETSDTENFAIKEELATFNAPADSGNGATIGQRFPRPTRRYSRLMYTPGSGVSGNVTAYLTPDISTR